MHRCSPVIGQLSAMWAQLDTFDQPKQLADGFVAPMGSPQNFHFRTPPGCVEAHAAPGFFSYARLVFSRVWHAPPIFPVVCGQVILCGTVLYLSRTVLYLCCIFQYFIVAVVALCGHCVCTAQRTESGRKRSLPLVSARRIGEADHSTEYEPFAQSATRCLPG